MFEFCTHARTLVGAGASDALGETLAARWGASRVLLVTDGALVSLGLAGRLRDALTSAGHTVAMFDEVVADPPESVVERAITAARDARAQMIVGFGGGSSMDVAKLAAAFAGTTQDLRQAYGIGLVAGPRLPLVQVPTTAGTGSEATPIAVVTTGEGAKAGVISPVLYADLAVLDASLTLGLPPAITAATGIDAMVHATEAYTSRVLKNPISDALAREALRLLFRALPVACRDGGDLAARQDMLLGAMLAGQAFANAPVGAVHALAYPLGSAFHVPHGLSNSLVLGPVLRFNSLRCETQYAELADVILPGHAGGVAEKAAAFVQAMAEVAGALELPTRLVQVGVTAADIPALAGLALQQQRLLANNPRDVTLADATRRGVPGRTGRRRLGQPAPGNRQLPRA
ncbi:alcohol dehydrogenase, iron-dependent, partial [Bordetella pertussis H973]